MRSPWGKTIETGLILRYLLVSQKVKRVLILAPASIQPQWHEELREKFNLHFWSYNKGELKNPDGEKSLSGEENIWNSQNLILASSHLVRRSDRSGERTFSRATVGFGGTRRSPSRPPSKSAKP